MENRRICAVASTPTYSRQYSPLAMRLVSSTPHGLSCGPFVVISMTAFLGIVFGGGIGDNFDFPYLRRSDGRKAAVIGKLPTVNPDHCISDTENGNLLFLVDSYSCHFVQQVHCGSRLSEYIVGDIHRIMPRACGEYRTAGCHGNLIDQNRLRQKRYV